MSKSILFLLLCFVSLQSSAQYTLRIELVSVPATHINDPVFVAGNFNRWQPGKDGYNFLKQDGKLIVEVNGLEVDYYEFKFIRGNWKSVEVTSDGKDVENRVIKLISDTTVQCSIEGWKDDFFPVTIAHTAGARVQVMDTAFFIPQLNRHRRIWVYLPEGYATGKRRYPVMYMHDGQNIFDEATSAFGEWGVDEILDSLVAAGVPACIVIGIDNGGTTRMSEYNPYEFILKREADSSQKFLPEGEAYISFLVQTLKPFIDKKYRTLPSKDNTIIAGSSMGGLISYYAMLRQPDVFGKAGIFSPAFWTANPIKFLTDSLAGKINGKFFFYAGVKEGEAMINDMEDVQEILGERSSAMIYSVIDPESSHNEKAWRKWFDDFYTWIMADGYNTVIKIKD